MSHYTRPCNAVYTSPTCDCDLLPPVVSGRTVPSTAALMHCGRGCSVPRWQCNALYQTPNAVATHPDHGCTLPWTATLMRCGRGCGVPRWQCKALYKSPNAVATHPDHGCTVTETAVLKRCGRGCGVFSQQCTHLDSPHGDWGDTSRNNQAQWGCAHVTRTSQMQAASMS